MMLPVISGSRVVYQSRWICLIEKDVRFDETQDIQQFYSLEQPAYVSIVALTPDGRIPIVSQYRPAVEAYTWELPAGTIDSNETPVMAARRELREETGLHADELDVLGSYFPDTGRLQVPSYVAFARTRRPDPDFTPEAGMALRFVSPAKLTAMVLAGEFIHQIHLAALYVAHATGALPLTTARSREAR